MSPIAQDNLLLKISTDAGADVLRVQGIRGEERLSGLFHFMVETVSLDAALDFDSIVGTSATLTIALPSSKTRMINGIVTRFIQGATAGGLTRYYLELRPWLWLLTLATDSKIYQAKSVPDILEAIFTELGYTDHTNSLTATYTARDYCVQYQETAFDFISRLMEEEGISYFFQHEDGKHTMVLADDPATYAALPSIPSLKYLKSVSTTQIQANAVVSCSLEHNVISAEYAMSDYNFETPDSSLVATATASGTIAALKRFEYPGKYKTKSDGDAISKLRAESCESLAKMLTGESYCADMTSGYTFTLTDHDREDVNASYTIYSVTHDANQLSYRNTFEAIPATVTFRPPLVTPKPRIAGAHTALVVGKAGEEIWTDKYGRVVVQFYWDRLGVKDEKSSCWVRVAQGWAGKTWGAVFIPRIGQEVIVSFLDGDPDRPIITGSVYNATQTVPYALPDDQTKSTVKSNSSKGGAGFNELRFEDKKDSEEIYVHAQKDMKVDVLHDSTTTITNDRTITVSEGKEVHTITKGDRTVDVQAGKETHNVKGTREVKVTGDETHTNEANFDQKVTGNYTLKVTGNLTIEADGDVIIKSAKTVAQKAGTTFDIEAGTALTNKAGTALKNKAGTTLDNEAGTTLTNKGVSVSNEASAQLKSKGALANLEADGIVTVKGSLVKIN